MRANILDVKTCENAYKIVSTRYNFFRISEKFSDRLQKSKIREKLKNSIFCLKNVIVIYALAMKTNGENKEFIKFSTPEIFEDKQKSIKINKIKLKIT